jgi:signal transduction histidine kinase
MTHEFKTPIATINLAIDAIKKKLMGKVDTKSMGYLNIIKDENNRMNNQVENVLMISQLEKEKIELEMKMMDLNKLVQLAIDRVQLLSVSVGARISKKFDKKENIMMLAEEEMINVFVNILENSLKYSKSNPVIQIMVKNEKSNTTVFFKDNGIGMTKKIKTKIFEKFYRETKGNIHNIKGHGLGLAFVKKIIDLHAGFISVQSQIGKGSTFKITLNNVNKT